MHIKIFLKSVQDVDVKLMLCKSNFQWELLAKKYEEIESEIKEFYNNEIPVELEQVLGNLRIKLVEKKGVLPVEDFLLPPNSE